MWKLHWEILILVDGKLLYINFLREKIIDLGQFFVISFNFNPFLENRDPCTSYLPGLVDSDWSSGNNFHCNYMLNYELFPFFYCYDVINSIFYKTNSYSEIRNWSITLKGLLYIHIQINFVTRVPLDSIQLLKRHQVSPPEVSTLFRPWCNTKQKPFLT